MFDLTDKQQRILDLVQDFIVRYERPPTIRELAEGAGYRSPRSIQQYLDVLERKGAIERDPNASRGIRLVAHERGIPVLGTVPAGAPMLADEHVESHLDLEDWLGTRPRSAGSPVFAVRVTGESMRDCGILDGDHVLVQRSGNIRNGVIAVVLIDGDATVKRFFRRGKTITLQPENPEFKPIVIQADDGRDVQVAGPVIGVVRRYN